MGDWLTDAYRTRIVDTGRESLFLLLLGLIGSFLFIRFSVRMIRRGVKWWPGNVKPGGVHIHHVVFGQAMLLIGGIGEFAVRGGGRVVHNVLAVVFGIGCGLVLDEFALVLHLEDVYWAEQGRQSVDAVILAVSVLGLLLIGQAPLGGYVGGASVGSYVVAGVLLGFVVLCLLKGKVWTGLLGVMVPLLALVGALRLARPASPWARWRYASKPRRMARAERREDRIHRRVAAVKTTVMDAVAGAPTPGPAGATGGRATGAGAGAGSGTPRQAAATTGPTIVDLPPSRLEVLLERVLRPSRGPGAAVAVWYLRVASGVNVVTGLITPFRRGVRAATDGEYVTAFLVSPGFTGAVLAFVLSVSLRRRKRAAWIVTVVLVAGYTVLLGITLGVVGASRGHPLNWVSVGLTLLLLAALLVSRPVFNVRGERGNAALGLLSLLIGAVVAVGAGTLLVYANDHNPPSQWGLSARYAAVRVLTVSGLFDLSGIEVPGWTDLAVNMLSVALMLAVLLAFFRAPRGRARLGPSDEQRLRELLRAYGDRDAFGYFALRRDRSVCWAPDGSAAVVYRVVNGVALASGDPLGPRPAWPAAVAHWLALTRRHGWVPAVPYAGPAGAVVYEAAGFRVVASGEDAVVEVADFAAAFAADTGPAAVWRVVGAAGYSALLRREREVPAEEWERLGLLADAWRREGARWGAGVELGRLGDSADPDCLVAECLDPRDRTCALLRFVPWGADGLTLDLVRHDRESGRSPVDFLLTEVLRRAATGTPPLAGIHRLSLNLRVRRPSPTPTEPFGSFSAFTPRRRERYLLFERRAELPRVILAAALTDGFPSRRRLRHAAATPATTTAAPPGR